jgi:hypothetical protein
MTASFASTSFATDHGGGGGATSTYVMKAVVYDQRQPVSECPQVDTKTDASGTEP